MILMKQLALIKFLSAATIVCAADVPITQDELVRRTQELYDSLVSGNQAPWEKYFADDCMFADEKGRFFDKPKLIADITPDSTGELYFYVNDAIRFWDSRDHHKFYKNNSGKAKITVTRTVAPATVDFNSAEGG